MSLALLTGPEVQTEKELYTRILNSTKYKSKGLRLIDYEDIDLVVDSQLKQYSDLYLPVIEKEEPFKDILKIVEKDDHLTIIRVLNLIFNRLRTNLKTVMMTCLAR